MFEGSVTDLDNSEWQARFRDFGERSSQHENAAEIVAYAPGTLVTPTDITQKVVEDLDKIKDLHFHVPNIYAAVVQEEKIQKARFRHLKNALKFKISLQRVFLAAALGSILFGLYLSNQGLQANQATQAQASRLSAVASSSDPGSVPSATKPTAAVVASYSVSPDMPKYIDISKLNVHARVLALDTNKAGALQAPGNIYDTGWYRQSAEPGRNGAMLIDGHISNWQARGVFYGLNQLVGGDVITVTRGDNQKFNYKVVKSQLFDADHVDMSSLMVSQATSKPGLNLISCSGDVIPGTNEFDKRLVIYAIQI